MVSQIAQFGGVFALLVFWHFVADWIFQTHSEAMAKAKDARIRAQHCFTYAVIFAPAMGVLQLTWAEALVCWVVLFASHFVEDTYIPVMLWAKHVRQPPEFKSLPDEEAFVAWASTPLGKIIAIVVDQLVHLAFLFPIAYYAVT